MCYRLSWKQLNLFRELLDFYQDISYSLCWKMMYHILQWYFMSTDPLSYAEYLTQQLLMNYPVSMIRKRSFFVNNHLESLSWQLWFSVTPCILIKNLDQLKLYISLCAYFWFQKHEIYILLHWYPEIWHHTIDTSTDYLWSYQCVCLPKWMIYNWVPQYSLSLMVCGWKGDDNFRVSYHMGLLCRKITWWTRK